VVTALTPFIGYQQSASLAHQALTSGHTIRELVLAEGLMSEDDLDRVLSPARLSGIIDPTTAIVVPELGDDSA
jgi:aspartate ammonia-lyase